MTLPFTKMQAVGNDFVVLDEAIWGADTDWAKVALSLCDRHKGVGADGLLVVCPSRIADVWMRMFNPDGTEDMCGNGLRCVVLWAWERGYFSGKIAVGERTGFVETLAGIRGVDVVEGDEIRTDMGTPLFAPNVLPVVPGNYTEIIDYPLPLANGEIMTVSTVNTGSTHTVIWVDELPDDERFLSISPQIEHHPLYPERTSVLWVKPGENSHTLEVRIWERGVGETLGCGTGACAIAVLGRRQNKVQLAPWRSRSLEFCRVKSYGGELNVFFSFNNGETHLILSGTAETVYSGLI